MSRTKPKYGRIDNNQKEIVDELRKRGFTVEITSNVANGVPDIMAGWNGRTYLFEIKSKGGKLTSDQVEWHDQWQGHKAVIYSVEEAIKIMMEDNPLFG
jgi:Holliday junction resolvase